VPYINLDEDNKFEPWPEKDWPSLGATVHTVCGKKAAFYRITHDDYLCLECGKAVPRTEVAG
jgi:hypothetical protein